MKRSDDDCNDRWRRKRRRSTSYDDDQRAEDGNWPRGETSNRHDSDIPYYYSYRGRRSSPLYDDYGSMRTPLRSYHSSVANHTGYRNTRRSSVDEEDEWISQHRRSASPWEDYAYRPRRMSTPPYSRKNMEHTDEYISTSLQPSWRLDDPTGVRKLLIVDLNGSLLLRSAHSKRRHDPTQKNLRTVYPRPYLHAFRSYILHEETKKWLDTMVWSSAQPHSVEDMVEKCFQGRRHELKAVWARDTLGLNQHEYRMYSSASFCIYPHHSLISRQEDPDSQGPGKAMDKTLWTFFAQKQGAFGVVYVTSGRFLTESGIAALEPSLH